jgi:hypothetical protein
MAQLLVHSSIHLLDKKWSFSKALQLSRYAAGE